MISSNNCDGDVNVIGGVNGMIFVMMKMVVMLMVIVIVIVMVIWRGVMLCIGNDF